MPHINHFSYPTQRGFTLVELIMTILILGIVGLGLGSYIRASADVYSDVVGRESILSNSRFVLQRMTRELREALPNSVRVGRSGTVQCVEFVPIIASSTYITIPALPAPASDAVRLVQHGVSGVTASKLVVYPQTVSQIYTDYANQTLGRTFALQSTPSAGTSAETVNLSQSVQFERNSPTQRYYLVDTAVSYCTDSVSNTVVRYSGYWPCLPTNRASCGQQFPPNNSQVLGSLVTAIMADQQTNHATDTTAPFRYSGATLVRNAVIQLNFAFSQDSETIQFNHEVHIVNVP